MRAAAALSIVLLTVLAGCFDGDGDGDPTGTQTSTVTGTGTTTTATTTTGTGTGPPANRAPTITVATATTDGNTTFTLTLADADGDALTWTLDLDGTRAADGSLASDGTATHTAALAAGDHTYTATVDDGDDATTTNGTVTVEATAVHQSASGSLVAGIEACGPASAFRQAGVVPLSSGSPTDDVSRASFALDRATIGNTWTLSWTFDVGYIAIYTFFTDAGGNVTSATWTEEPDTSNYQATGTVPDADYVVLYACAGPSEADWSYRS